MFTVGTLHRDNQLTTEDDSRKERHSRFGRPEPAKRVISVGPLGRSNQHSVDPHGRGPRKWQIAFPSPDRPTDPVTTELIPSESWRSPRVKQNDIVVVAGERGTWKVLAPVNGSKADIRRREGSDSRIVTTSIDNLRVIRCAGSPGYRY